MGLCRASRVDSPEGINVDTVLKAVLKLARKHEVGPAKLQFRTCVGLDSDVQLVADNAVADNAAASCNLMHSPPPRWPSDHLQ